MEVTATQPAKGPERLGRGPAGAISGSAVRSPAAQKEPVACGLTPPSGPNQSDRRSVAFRRSFVVPPHRRRHS